MSPNRFVISPDRLRAAASSSRASSAHRVSRFENARHPLGGKTRPAAVAVDRAPRVPAVRSEQKAESGEDHHDEDPEQDDVHEHMLERLRLAGKSRWTPL
jgi:hypothetical protein